MQNLRVTGVQKPLVWESVAGNLAQLEQALSALPSTDLIVLPEMFNTGFTMAVDRMAEAPDGPSSRWLLSQAARHQAAIYGSLIIRENNHFFNRGLFAFPDGRLACYDKRHLFCLSEEKTLFEAGSVIQTVEWKGWRIRLCICYDLRFPVWLRNRYRDGHYDYDVLVCIANWPEARADVWQQLLAARAIENQAYVVGINRVGTDGQGIVHRGDSQIIDPYGRSLAQAKAHAETLVSGTLDRAVLDHFRQKFTAANDWDAFEISS